MAILLLLYGCLNSEILVRFHLDCDHKSVSCSDTRDLNHDTAQKAGTYIQDSHSAPSIKGKSRSASKK